MSELRTGTVSNEAGTGPVILTKQYPAKAHGRILMTAGVPSITGSDNFTSVTDVSVGLIQMNYTNTVSSVASTTVTESVQHSSAVGTNAFLINTPPGTTSYATLQCFQNGASSDPTLFYTSVFGDLA